MGYYFMGCLLTIYWVSKAYFFLFIYQLMWAWNKHPWSRARENKCDFVSTSIWPGEYEQVLLFFLGSAHFSQVGVGPEQGSRRMPASGSKEETSLSPFTFLQYVKPGVTLLWLCSLISFPSSKREENKISLMFFNIFSSQCPLTSFPSPIVTFPKSNLSLTNFEIKLGIMN